MIKETTSWMTVNGRRSTDRIIQPDESVHLRMYPADPNIIDSRPRPAVKMQIATPNVVTLCEFDEYGELINNLQLTEDEINHNICDYSRKDPLGRTISVMWTPDVIDNV